jgi:uncharacterized protein YndB with AHSA1/START domain
MREIHGSASDRVDADAEAVFRLITDVGRLPEWNDAIESVVERPSDLTTGAEWIVKMHPSRMMSWKSRSTVEEIDRDAHRFTYRTVNADGNPSYTEWNWEITPLESGADVSVTWDVYLETIDRRLLAGPIRQRQLRKEVAASLHAIDGATRPN